MAAPERTCVGCRRKRAQAELVRFILEAGRVVPASAGARGRSAYVCPEVDCLETAEKKRAFARAFRAPVTVDPTVRRAVTRRASDERR